MIDPENIDHNVKHANKKAMEYYVEQKVLDCKHGLAKKLLANFYGWEQKFVTDIDFNKLPLSVTVEYDACITKYKNAALLNYAEKSFLRYVFRLEHENRYLVLSSEQDPNYHALKLLTTRYHSTYCDKIKKRMQWLAYTYQNKPSVLLTLTLDPKKFANDKFIMWDVISKEVDRFMKALRMHFKRAGRMFPKYLWAVEGQRNGNPHLHIVFFNARRLIDWRDILKYWGNGAIYLNKNKDGQRVKYPINYVTSYITKTFGNTNFDNVRTQSLVWLFNHRSFNRSWGLIVPLNPKSCGDYHLDYLAITDVMSNRLDEMDAVNDCVDTLFGPKHATGPPAMIDDEYVIYVDDDGVYSTDSPFWRDFFT